jgi:arylsulfatase
VVNITNVPAVSRRWAATVGCVLAGLTLCVAATPREGAAAAEKEAKKPNILVIWGDDIGQDNISIYHRGIQRSRIVSVRRPKTQPL